MWNRGLLLAALAIIITVGGANAQKPRIGESINLLKRYGHFFENLSIRFMLKNVTDARIYRESGSTIFKPPPSTINVIRFGGSSVMVSANIQVAFCTKAEQLMQEVFNGFVFEGIKEPWRAFQLDWSKSTIARIFGINEFFVQDDYRYILLKIIRSSDNQLAFEPSAVELDADAATGTERVFINDTASTFEFIKRFGTHYISSYSTGDALYQVFVYRAPEFEMVKKVIEKKSIYDLDTIEKNWYFSSPVVSHVGRIQSASGDASFEKWVTERLKTSSWSIATTEPHSSLLNIIRNDKLLIRFYRKFDDRALLRMELKYLSAAFRNSTLREWFNFYISSLIKYVITYLSK
ncbi:torso-like protein [Venturia canescens]|uniref:torso-like protein n=1 Tax=Venturia canescens TaxID=32260 RepID=UPI001C9D0E90|nr:torso-like protein [Venturia canescens]XP_043270138.1 torso-like protein [Venturia canescens]